MDKSIEVKDEHIHRFTGLFSTGTQMKLPKGEVITIYYASRMVVDGAIHAYKLSGLVEFALFAYFLCHFLSFNFLT